MRTNETVDKSVRQTAAGRHAGAQEHEPVAPEAAVSAAPTAMAIPEGARRAADSMLGANPIVGLTRGEVRDSVRRLFRLLAVNPRTVLKKEREFAAELGRIIVGKSVITSDPRDRRFAHPIWHRNGYYRRLMQTYVAWSRSVYEIIDSVDADSRDRERARFMLMQIVDAASPTNNPLGNPGFLANALKTRGMSIVRGLRNLADDILNNGGMPRQVDERPFRVGRNIACSEGAVVFRSPVCEVIQYGPKTAEVSQIPVLVIPPQLNKYYIVDLAPETSFVKYGLDSGLQVFCISWRNPTATHRDWGMETYVSAAKEAIDAVREITGSPSVNLVAASTGGFTAAVLAGHLWASGEGYKVNSLTLMVTVLDTGGETLLGLFADEAAMKAAAAASRRKGVMNGGEMARAFAWLRPSDQVWSYVANNYLMGNNPPAYDVLYWNNDSTRLPAQFHADIMSLFRKNPLARPGAMKILGTEIDLAKVDCDVFVVAGITDHITPWQACYRSMQLFGGDTNFVLASSGHIQSIVSPPGNPRAKFYVNEKHGLDAMDWLEQASLSHGSWWNSWRDWMLPRSGGRQPTAAGLGSSKFPAGDAAPGRYVHQR